MLKSPTRYVEPSLEDVREEAEQLRRIIEESGVEAALRDILSEIDEWKVNHPKGATEERKRLAHLFVNQMVTAWVLQHRGIYFDPRMETVL